MLNLFVEEINPAALRQMARAGPGSAFAL